MGFCLFRRMSFWDCMLKYLGMKYIVYNFKSLEIHTHTHKTVKYSWRLAIGDGYTESRTFIFLFVRKYAWQHKQPTPSRFTVNFTISNSLGGIPAYACILDLSKWFIGFKIILFIKQFCSLNTVLPM